MPVPVSDVCTPLAGTPASGTFLAFSLPNLPLGTYKATLSLQTLHTAAAPKRLPLSNRQSKLFRVVSRADTLPQLVTPSAPVEGVVEEKGGDVEVMVPHMIYTPDASILQADDVKVCLRLVTAAESQRISDLKESEEGALAAGYEGGSCLSVHDTALLSAGRVKEGVQHFAMILKDGEKFVLSSEVRQHTNLVFVLSIFLSEVVTSYLLVTIVMMKICCTCD